MMNIWQQLLSKNIWLIGVNGRLDQSLNPKLEETLQGLLQQEQYQLIVDLTETNYINSGGLRALVSAWRRTHENSGNLVICGLSERLQEIFSMVGFDKVFQIYSDQTAALKSFQTGE